jgi:GNAT superfamily N-acetyltransferase
MVALGTIGIFSDQSYLKMVESMRKFSMTGEHGQAHTYATITLPPLDPAAVFETLASAGLGDVYPDFRGWFFGKVVPGVRKGERCIIPRTIDSKLIGIAICKRTPFEQKLCTLWVSPDVRARGVAAKLARDAFDWLGNTKPLFTVPEERAAQFAGLVKTWAFPDAVAYDGLYRGGRVEFVFNGPPPIDVH